MTARLSRRGLLAGTAALAACRRTEYPNDGHLHLSFSTWGEGEEVATLERLVDAYNRSQPRVRVHLERVSYRFEESLDTRLAAGRGPDVFRVSYTNMSRYTPSGTLIDLTPYLPPQLAGEFLPTAWNAVLYRGQPRALPHHTDTSALIVNTTILRRTGIRLPQQLSEAWTWDEFLDVARAVKRAGAEYGFVMNWTYGGTFRWLNFLHQRGGQLLQDDLRTPAVPSRESVETIAWLQRWFREKLTPGSASVKTNNPVEQIFMTQTAAIMFDVGLNGVRLRQPTFDWAVTYLPRDRHQASELGGTAIGVSRDCRHPAEAADFAMFLTGTEAMRDFCASALYLPVRRALEHAPLAFPYRGDQMRFFREQASTIPVQLVREMTVPGFLRIHRRMETEFSMAFSGGQSPEATLTNVATEIRRVLA